MTREEFRAAVFARDHGKCVVCAAPAVDAHHLMERRLWADGGYHLDNGVSLCAEHHLQAEQTRFTPDELRRAAGITRVLLPEHLDADEQYDKWGNIYLADGRRAPGELFYDESVQRILSGCLDEFSRYVKYPRTFHLPWSPGATQDDRILTHVPWEGQEVVVTEKLDGENTTMYRDHIHARSIDSGGHPTRSWVKNLHAQIAHDIPAGWRVCGENLQARHSIQYERLPSYFLVFGIWNEHNECLSWPDTVEWSELLELPLVPMLYSGLWDEGLEATLQDEIRDGAYGESEGYVVRPTRALASNEWRTQVGKYVRANHVRTDHHWRHRPLVPNLLA